LGTFSSPDANFLFWVLCLHAFVCLISHSPLLLVKFMQHTYAGRRQVYDPKLFLSRHTEVICRPPGKNIWLTVELLAGNRKVQMGASQNNHPINLRESGKQILR
jgi:hypothetical protein